METPSPAALALLPAVESPPPSLPALPKALKEPPPSTGSVVRHCGTQGVARGFWGGGGGGREGTHTASQMDGNAMAG